MRKRIFLSIAVAVLALVPMLYGQSADTEKVETDPVLNYYVNKADSVFIRTDLEDNPVRFSFLAFTYYKNIGRKGVVSRLDSVVTRYYCSGNKIDSTRVLVRPQHSIPEITLGYPNIFKNYFEHSFFPNDIGDIDLAIGFDNHSAKDTLPTGIAVINRDNYELHRLYLYYPNNPDYKRLTRSYRLTEYSGLVFPDSIWEVGSKQGIFTTENYRLETEIGQLKFME